MGRYIPQWRVKKPMIEVDLNERVFQWGDQVFVWVV